MSNSFVCLLDIHVPFPVMYLSKAPIYSSTVLPVILDISPLPDVYIEETISQGYGTVFY